MDEAQVRKQAEELVAQMTLDEAAAQLKYNAPAKRQPLFGREGSGGRGERQP